MIEDMKNNNTVSFAQFETVIKGGSEMGMKINTNNEKLNSIFSVIINEGRLDYSQDDYHVLINYLVDRINSHKPEKRIQVVIIDEEDGKHSLDINVIKNNIFVERDSKTDPLTADEIEALQNLYKDGYSKSTLAKVFGYSRNTINKYLN